MSDSKNDMIVLTLPINAAYVSAARLTASSVSNRLGFSIDEIEEIKAAVSEACTYIVKYFTSKEEKNFCVKFKIMDNILNVVLTVYSAVNSTQEEDDMGLCMIRALVDEFSLDIDKDDTLSLTMIKKHNTSSFD